MSSTQDFNPYEPPRFVESIADDELADGGIFVPSWGSVIANAAFVSILLGVVLTVAVILTKGILLLSLLILMPLSFSWHFCRTYRLPYRSVPKFGWLPWAFVFLFSILAVMSGSAVAGLELLLGSHPWPKTSQRQIFGVMLAGCLGVSISCLSMDFSLTQYVPRKSDPKKTLLIPVGIGLASILYWLPIAYFEVRRFGKTWTPMRDEEMGTMLILASSFVAAVFYSLIMAYPTVRERMLSAKSDPRQFTKRDFQL